MMQDTSCHVQVMKSEDSLKTRAQFDRSAKERKKTVQSSYFSCLQIDRAWLLLKQGLFQDDAILHTDDTN